MADARQFRLALDQFVEKQLPEKVAETQRMMVAELLTLIVQSTPVGNHTKWKRNVARAERGLGPLPKGYVGGQARRNWQVTIGQPSAQPKKGTDASGQKALSDGYAQVAKITKPTIAFISNPLPYMVPLENGWSKQAPNGMVARAIALVTAKYRRVA